MPEKRRRSPQEKKHLSYKRDYVYSGGESATAFRKTWPRKEAQAQRAYRRALRQATALLKRTDDHDAESIDGSLRREEVQKWGVASLGEVVPGRIKARRLTHGARKRRHAQRKPPRQIDWERLIEGLTSEKLRKKGGRRNLDWLQGWAEILTREMAGNPALGSKALPEFLEDNPELAERLKAWIEEIQSA